MGQADPELLKVEGLRKTYRAKRSAADILLRRAGRVVTALDGISFAVGRNEVLGIVGESGSGKTTAARCLVRLETADTGTIRFDGRDVGAAGGGELRRIRREMQIIYQDPYSSLNPRFTVRAAISEPALVHGLVGREQADAMVDDLLDRVGLSRTVADLRPRALSGGQRQRVAIARALALQPRFIIADEAVSALDVSVQAQILNLFGQLIRDLGLGMIFISHQLAVIAQLSDRVAVMYLGRIVETGPTREVFANPRHPYTQALLRAHPEVDAPRARNPALGGEIPSNYAIPHGCRFHTRCPHAIDLCKRIDPPAAAVSDGHLSCCHVLPAMHGSPLAATTS
jgi:oligopeptide/dipeptide ABC transporter ATP-binding protein